MGRDEVMGKRVNPSKCHPEKLNFGHGMCEACYRREYYKNNREKVMKIAMDHYWRHHEKNKQKANDKYRSGRDRYTQCWIATIKRKYGITPEIYEEKLKFQGGVCEICKEPPTKKLLCIDHNHETGQVRSLLCGNCNKKLGFIENAKWKDLAEAYLKRWSRSV